MSPELAYAAVAGGLVALVAGGELLVRGASALAGRLGVSPLLIGLTVVGFGTSTPELVTSIQAALADAPAIAIGNVVGSNIANILLILGLAVALQPIAVQRRALGRDGGAMLLATALLVAAMLWGEIGRVWGTVLVAGLVVYLVIAYRSERGQPTADEPDVPAMSLPAAIALAAGGILATIVGAGWLVDGAVEIATVWGVSQAVIGLTIVAVGTSLPELVTAVVAALRREADLAFGNVIGSNIYNILGILGVTALVQPIAVPERVAAFDMWIMVGATVALVVLAATGRLPRAVGFALLLAYALYILWIA